MPSPDPPYQGAPGRTRVERRAWACRCGERFAIELLRAVDAVAEPEALRQLVDGRANRARCARCGADEPVGVTVVIHDPARPLLLLFLPDSLRHRELEERGRLYLALAADGTPAPRYAREFQVALGADELRGLLAHPPPALAEATTDPRQVTPAQERPAIADPRAAAIERWANHREPATTLVVDDEVIHLAALPRGEAGPFLEGPLELRVQLHRMPSYPLVVLTLLTSPSTARPRALHAFLEIGRAAHRAVLERLVRRAAVTTLLFSPEYQPLARQAASAPLEKNVARLFTAAREALKRVPSGQRDFEAARRAFLAPDYDRLGRVEPELSAARGPLDRPSAVRRAVAEIQRWSEAGAEAYLVEIRSFPVAEWSALRERVVRRALDLGLHARRSLVERVLTDARVNAPWPEVVSRQLAAFAQVAAGRDNDLPRDDEAENWRLLLAEARSAGVTASAQLQGLAQARSSRPQSRDDEPTLESPTFDPRRPLPELCALLERRELRRDVALSLCERRDPSALRPLFQALSRMTRAEVSAVLPAMVAGFGDGAAPYLVAGLRSRRSYLRQGCALGLGTLSSAVAIEPLLALLRSEPTEVWREVARALGDLGPAVAPALGQRLRTAEGEEWRERLVRALAHLGARSGREAVERLAAAHDEQVAAAARRALQLAEEVRQADREVRVEAPRDQTVVRAFSRRFFEALGEDAGVAELDARELAEADAHAAVLDARDLEGNDEDTETLDEADLVEETPPPAILVSRTDSTQPRMILPPDRAN